VALTLAGTPIGNLKDASESLREALASAEVIAAEDTRRARNLLSGLGISTQATLVSYFDGNEAARAQELLRKLRDGASVLVISDAGMPTISDPGYRLVTAAVAEGIEVNVVPGPSAVLVALALSGLPTDRFCFEGFLPRKTTERARRLASLADEERTMVFFESPHRLEDFLTAAIAAFGPGRQASVSRELTKVFEETRRGTLAELAQWASEGVRGEVTVCVAGRLEAEQVAIEDAVELVLAAVKDGVALSAASAHVAAQTEYSRSELYDLARRARDE
jgi:16S rRNA (cytidine1402-2'-O)-methyltransferase